METVGSEKVNLTCVLLIGALLLAGCASNSKPFPRLSDEFNDAFKKFGAPYKQVPVRQFHFGRNMVVGWDAYFKDEEGNNVIIRLSGSHPGGFAP